MKPIIEVKNIGKQYRLGEFYSYSTLRDNLVNCFRKKAPKKEFWALKDVSFDVQAGDTLGIIGSNGAGKSTLLKILSRITPPTSGQITMRGKTASLLEVGTGFNPELTGRENIYLNGAILGMTRDEINRKFEEMVDFAGTREFLDTPVKRYSSGMRVRLAFAVAAHLEPEILIIDEVLAVGDVAFQQKCLGKMNDVARGGRTVLFVSHNMGAVKKLCRRSVWLENGKVNLIGDTEAVIDSYLSENRESKAVIEYPKDKSKKVQIRKISVLDKEGAPQVDIDASDKFFIDIEYDVREKIEKPNFTCLTLVDSSDNIILQAMDIDTNEQYYRRRDEGKYRVKFELPENLFNSQSIKIVVRCGIPPKYNIGDAIDAFFDRKDNLAFNLFVGNNFSKNFFGGARPGALLAIIKSEVKHFAQK